MKKRFKRSIFGIAAVVSNIFVNVKFKLNSERNNTLLIGTGSIFLRSKVAVKGSNNLISISNQCRFKKLDIRLNGNGNTIIIEDSVRSYEGCQLNIAGDNCVIHLKTKTTVGKALFFCGESDTKIIVGEDCMLSREIRLNTSDFHSILDANTQQRINHAQSIVIGNHVWIGNSAYIGKGTVLSDDSVVATRAVLSGKTYPANAIIAGIPGRVVKEGIVWSREKLP